MRRKLIWIVAVVGLLAAGLVGAVGYRSAAQHEEMIRVEAFFLMTSCETCLDMEVTAVRPARFSRMVRSIIDPYADDRDLGDYIYGRVNAGAAKRFCLTGRLHRYTNSWDFLAQPPYAFPFKVEKIDQKQPCFD